MAGPRRTPEPQPPTPISPKHQLALTRSLSYRDGAGDNSAEVVCLRVDLHACQVHLRDEAAPVQPRYACELHERRISARLNSLLFGSAATRSESKELTVHAVEVEGKILPGDHRPWRYGDIHHGHVRGAAA